MYEIEITTTDSRKSYFIGFDSNGRPKGESYMCRTGRSKVYKNLNSAVDATKRICSYYRNNTDMVSVSVLNKDNHIVFKLTNKDFPKI